MAAKKQKPRVRKPNNHHERLRRSVDRIVKNVAVVYQTGRHGCDMVDVSDMDNPKRANPTLTKAKAIAEFAHLWSIYIAVFGQVNNEPVYVKGEQLVLPCRYKQKDLAAGLNEYHQQFINKTINKDHLVGVGWIAIPRDVALTNEQADKIFQTAKGADHDR